MAASQPPSANAAIKPFGFLHLPPEMRNALYDACLTHDRTSGRTASVAFLRTCKQVHSEAAKLFRAQSVFTIVAGCGNFVDRAGVLRTAVRISGDVPSDRAFCEASILELATALPRAQITALKAKVIFEHGICLTDDRDAIARGYFSTVNLLLYVVVSKLNSQPQVQQLSVELDRQRCAHPQHGPRVLTSLYPLEKLDPRIGFRVVAGDQKIVQPAGRPPCISFRPDCADYIRCYHELANDLFTMPLVPSHMRALLTARTLWFRMRHNWCRPSKYHVVPPPGDCSVMLVLMAVSGIVEQLRAGDVSLEGAVSWVGRCRQMLEDAYRAVGGTEDSAEREVHGKMVRLFRDVMPRIEEVLMLESEKRFRDEYSWMSSLISAGEVDQP